MVQQLLLVGRLESQPPRPTADVLAIGPRVQRAWDALAVADRSLPPATTAHPTGWPSPTATSSTRSSGRSSTTPSNTGRARSRRDRRGRRPTGSCGRPISDDGRGLEEADRAWLFGRFERGAAGRTSGNGSGLGLYVSRALMRGMGGDLVLDAVVPGRGATFRLTLPGEPASEG